MECYSRGAMNFGTTGFQSISLPDAIANQKYKQQIEERMIRRSDASQGVLKSRK